MKTKNKYFVLVLVVITIGLLCVGGTYAYLSFTATVQNTISNGTSKCFLADFEAGEAIEGVLYQSKTPKGGLSGSVSMKINSTCNVSGTGTIKLNVASSTSNILVSEGALKYAVYENINSSPVASGSINAKGNTNLYSGFTLSTTAKTYYIYVWLDGTIADNDYFDVSFSGYIHAEATQTD